MKKLLKRKVYFFESLRLPLAKGSSTSLSKPLPFSEGRGCNRSSCRSEPLRYKVGGASEPSPGGYAGWDRMDTLFRMFAACSMLKGCLLDACCLLELLFEGTADKMDGALRNLLILSSYSP